MTSNLSQSSKLNSTNNNQVLFSTPWTLLLTVWIVVLFFIAQLIGIYLFAPIVFSEQTLTVAQRFMKGTLNGTVISYSMIFTMVIVITFIYGLVIWRIKKIAKLSKTKLSKANLTEDKLTEAKLSELDEVSKTVEHTTSANIQSNNNFFNASKYLALKPFSIKIGLAILGVWVAFVIISQYLSYFLERNPTAFVDDLYFTSEPKWLLILVMVVIAPIYEEFIFRGLIWQSIKDLFSSNKGAVVATLITSIIFSIIHLQYEIYEMAMVFILALLLGYARAISGSLWLPIIIHIVNNGLAMWLYLMAT